MKVRDRTSNKRGDPRLPREESRKSNLVPPGKRLPILQLFALLLCFLLLALLATRQIASMDVGFHLKAGESILSGQGWPRNDTFTYTLNDHPYIDTSWGYQVLVALVRRALDAPGLVIFHAAIVLATFFTLYRTARLVPVDATSLVLFLTAGGVASEQRFEVRPEILSYFFLAVVLYVLHRRAEGLRTPLWALPIIHLVWANCHSLIVLGWGAIACFIVGLWIRDRKLDWLLVRWGFASVAVAILNPYGWRGVVFPLTLMTRFRSANTFGGSILEFASPFVVKGTPQFPFYPRIPLFTFRSFAVVAGIALLALLLKKRFHAGFLILMFFPLAASMVRNMPLLSIAGLPGIVWALPAERILKSVWLSERSRRFTLAGTVAGLAVVQIFLGLWVIHDAYYIAAWRSERFGLSWNRLVLPVDAVRYMEKVGLKGPILNHITFGGYLMWARSDPVFIDGRLEVLGEDFFNYYDQLLKSQNALEAGVARYGIRSLIIPSTMNPFMVLRMSRDPRWRLVYFDHLAAIFVRNDETNGTAPPAMEIPPPGTPVLSDNLSPLPGFGGHPRKGKLAYWLTALIRKEDFPTQQFNRGIFHYYRGEMNLAGGWYSEAIRVSEGSYYLFYQNLGGVLYWLKRFPEARECYSIVLQADPENQIAQGRLDALTPR